MTHNLGAVQWGAPHSTEPRGQSLPQYGHCWQGADVMCYVEDAGAAHAMQQDCAGAPRRDPAELRLRPRRLLQPGAGARHLPGDALEHLRLGLPGAVRRDRPGLRRRQRCGCPTPPAATVRPDDRRHAAPRHDADRPARAPGATRRAATRYQWQRLDDGWEDIDGATGQTYVADQRRHRPPPAGHGRRHQRRRQRPAPPRSPPRRSAPPASTAPPPRRPRRPRRRLGQGQDVAKQRKTARQEAQGGREAQGRREAPKPRRSARRA